ncbi:hypothetical protein DEO72_LG6g394 [Vigna unguiculata]|uniref:Uncharacterized protein n=1 Tax=Vigna unguiculata TaxID=3917 RepID=A0A4D6M305_VIGUN|nr:hypothetical protein DEO72_LG6g394 [Vigna unguiculata]
MSLVFPFKRLFSPKTLSSVYLGLQMARDSCLTRVVAGAAMGGAVGGAVGPVF